MTVAGIVQGLMWKAIDDKTGKLMYPDFVETVTKIVPLYWVRALAGVLFIAGFVVMIYNIYKTIQAAPKSAPVKVQVTNTRNIVEVGATAHRKLEGATALFTVLTLAAILVGSIFEIYPTLSLHKYLPENVTVRPYSALEIAGRDIYIREGCYVCHSQQIRPLPDEVLRYGKPSTIEESLYDHPFQWGSKRTGPDLARVGKKYPDMWHFRHMMDPRSVTPNSIMPNYSWLLTGKTDFLILRKKISVMKNMGVPYSDEELAQADINAEKQAEGIASELESQGAPKGLKDKEIVALIAYLQSLGQTKLAGGK